MAKELSFDTFFDTHGADFMEYLGKAGANALPKKQYVALTKELQKVYVKHPKILKIFDTEEPCALSEPECSALIEVLLIKNELAGLESEQVYFKGCADSIGYLKKVNIL